MSGSRWVITLLWLSGSWRSFLYSSFVYSCHLFFIASASVRSFIEPIFGWNVPLVSLIFLKRSLVFPILLFSSISLHWLLRKVFLSWNFLILWNSAFKWVYLPFSPLPLASLLFSAICNASSDNHFAFLHFFLGMVLITDSCTMSWTSAHSSSGTLCIKSNPLNICHFHCIIVRDLVYVIPEWSSGFPYILQFQSEFGNKEFMIWAIVSSQSCFCWLYRASPSLPAKNIISLISVLTIWWCPCVESSLALLEEGVCYDQCVLLTKFC